MAASADEIDVTWEELVKTAMVMGRSLYGSIGLSDLKAMPVALFQYTINEFNKSAEEQSRGETIDG
jgi:hypothetical protein